MSLTVAIRYRAQLVREWWCRHTRGGHDWQQYDEKEGRVFAFRFWHCARCDAREVRFGRHAGDGGDRYFNGGRS